jgi:hypothetical protein
MSLGGNAAPAAVSAGTRDFSGDTVSIMDASDAPESAGPDLAEMQSMMEGAPVEVVIDAPAGDAPAGAPAAVPAKPAEAAPAAPAAAAPATPPAEADAALAARKAEIEAEAGKIRKGWAELSRSKEQAVRQVNEAKQAVAQAQQFKAAADQLAALPAKFKADPLGSLYEIVGLKTQQDQENFLTAVLDKVVETEKSPLEREFLRLKQELADKDKAQADANAKFQEEQAKAQNQRIIDEWTARNTAFATATPENAAKYDLIASLDLGSSVHETCVAYHKLHNVILDPQVAADHLEARLRAGLQKSKFLKTLTPAVAPAAPKPAQAAPAKSQPSNGTKVAPKQSGSTPLTLSNVNSGDGIASSEPTLPNDSDDRMEAVLRELQSEGLMPEDWRLKQ